MFLDEGSFSLNFLIWCVLLKLMNLKIEFDNMVLQPRHVVMFFKTINSIQQCNCEIIKSVSNAYYCPKVQVLREGRVLIWSYIDSTMIFLKS